MGGFARGATPFANGPRHCCQLPGEAAHPPTPVGSPRAENAVRQARRTNRRNGWVMLTDCVPCDAGMSKRQPRRTTYSESYRTFRIVNSRSPAGDLNRSLSPALLFRSARAKGEIQLMWSCEGSA